MPLRSLLVLVAGCCVVLPCARGAASSSTPSFAHARIEWNAPQKPFRIYGSTWYVGPHGLSAILVDTGKGLALFDGDLPESAPQIEAHLRELGFRVRDIKWIFNSHAHADHAGGIAALQQARDRKSTRLNSSHPSISYAVFCLKKKIKHSYNPVS